MKSVEIDISKLAKQVADDLKEYSEETAKIVDGCIDEVADQCVEKLKATSPRRTGQYAESWKAETVYSKSGNKRVVVRNKKYYYLTHLLEHGHAKKGGKGRVKAFVHIKPVEEYAQKALPELIETRLKK